MQWLHKRIVSKIWLKKLCIVSDFLLTKPIWKQIKNLVFVNKDAIQLQ